MIQKKKTRKLKTKKTAKKSRKNMASSYSRSKISNSSKSGVDSSNYDWRSRLRKKPEKSKSKKNLVVYNSKFRQFCDGINKYQNLTNILEQKMSPSISKKSKKNKEKGYEMAMSTTRSLVGGHLKPKSVLLSQSSIYKGVIGDFSSGRMYEKIKKNQKKMSSDGELIFDRGHLTHR